MTTDEGKLGAFADANRAATPSGPSPETVSGIAGIPCAWWRCIHCGHDKYEEHVFTGHMKGVPYIHCANCKALHNVPDPNSPRALRWRIGELAKALERCQTVVLEQRCERGTPWDLACMAIAAKVREHIDAALAIAGETGTAGT